VAEYDSAIPPGGQGKVVVTVRTRGIQGRRTKSIRLDTNDRQHRHVRLRVTFDSMMPVEVYPHPRAILHGFVGEEVEQTLVVRRRDGERLALDEPELNQQGVAVEIEPVDQENADPPGTRYGAQPGDWRIRLAYDGSARPLAQAARLRIKTNHPERPVLSIPLTLRIRPALIVRPQRVVLTATARQTGQPRRVVTLRHGGRAPYRLTGLSVEGDLPGVTATRRRDVRAAVQQIDVVLDPKELEPGIHRGHLLVQTDVSARPAVEIPIRVTVRPPPAAATTEAR
jgi:hypothetical protein